MTPPSLTLDPDGPRTGACLTRCGRHILYNEDGNSYITVQDPAHYGEPLIKTPWAISDSRSSWSRPGFEGKPIVVEVYAPGSEVELFVNGTSAGRQPCGPAHNFTAYFELPCQTRHVGSRGAGLRELNSCKGEAF